MCKNSYLYKFAYDCRSTTPFIDNFRGKSIILHLKLMSSLKIYKINDTVPNNPFQIIKL